MGLLFERSVGLTLSSEKSGRLFWSSGFCRSLVLQLCFLKENGIFLVIILILLRASVEPSIFVVVGFVLHFISAVHIWFISYIINTHIFYGNVWTHNWPAPNVSDFLAQLVEHRTGIAKSRVQTPLKSWIFFQASLRNCINCVHCDDHLFIFNM